jgi:hypothetical protein
MVEIYCLNYLSDDYILLLNFFKFAMKSYIENSKLLSQEIQNIIPGTSTNKNIF